MIEMDVEVTGPESAERTTGFTGHITRPCVSMKGRVLTKYFTPSYKPTN
jgi:hypothetical protein